MAFVMASSVTIRQYLLVIAIVCTVIISYTLAYDGDYEGYPGKLPDSSDSGHDEDLGHGEGDKGLDHGHDGEGLGHDEGDKGLDHGHDGEDLGPDEGDGGLDHGHEGEDSGEEGDKGPEVGGEGDHNDPPHIVSDGLLCLNQKHIYSSCEESFRLTVSGELHIPHEHVDEFCEGPCLEETNLVLHCIEGVMDHFLFYNKATTQDIRDTILAGCGHGEHRGDFNVAEHIEADGEDESIGRKSAIPVLLGVVIAVVGQILLL